MSQENDTKEVTRAQLKVQMQEIIDLLKEEDLVLHYADEEVECVGTLDEIQSILEKLIKEI